MLIRITGIKYKIWGNNVINLCIYCRLGSICVLELNERSGIAISALPGWAVENYEKPQSREPVSGPRLKPRHPEYEAE
jgi:hypothetical protein